MIALRKCDNLAKQNDSHLEEMGAENYDAIRVIMCEYFHIQRIYLSVFEVHDHYACLGLKLAVCLDVPFNEKER